MQCKYIFRQITPQRIVTMRTFCENKRCPRQNFASPKMSLLSTFTKQEEELRRYYNIFNVLLHFYISHCWFVNHLVLWRLPRCQDINYWTFTEDKQKKPFGSSTFCFYSCWIEIVQVTIYDWKVGAFDSNELQQM